MPIDYSKALSEKVTQDFLKTINKASLDCRRLLLEAQDKDTKECITYHAINAFSEYMSFYNWNPLSIDSRLVYLNYPLVMKIAIDEFSLKQNVNEVDLWNRWCSTRYSRYLSEILASYSYSILIYKYYRPYHEGAQGFCIESFDEIIKHLGIEVDISPDNYFEQIHQDKNGKPIIIDYGLLSSR